VIVPTGHTVWIKGWFRTQKQLTADIEFAQRQLDGGFELDFAEAFELLQFASQQLQDHTRQGTLLPNHALKSLVNDLLAKERDSIVSSARQPLGTAGIDLIRRGTRGKREDSSSEEAPDLVATPPTGNEL